MRITVYATDFVHFSVKHAYDLNHLNVPPSTSKTERKCIHRWKGRCLNNLGARMQEMLCFLSGYRAIGPIGQQVG